MRPAVIKSKFDAKVTKWLESKNVPQREIHQIVDSSRTLRLKSKYVQMKSFILLSVLRRSV